MTSDEVEVYLQPEYIQDFLQSYHKNTSIKVLKLDISPCGSSDGFLSILKRVKVEYAINSNETGSVSLIYKTESKDEFAKEKIGENGFNVTYKEMNFYAEVGQRIQKITKENFKCKVIPDSYKVDFHNRVIIFEDLNVRDFDLAKNDDAMNEHQTKLTLDKLAKFHAASVLIYEKYPKIFDNYNIGFLSRGVEAFNDAFICLFEVACDEISTWEGFEKIAEKIIKMQPFLIEKGHQCYDTQPEDICVLNHGDIWKNNIMFKRDQSDAVLIDFQFPQWISPVLDLQHLLYTSLNENLFNQPAIESFTQFYYYQLRDALTSLNYDMKKFPSLHSFQLDFDKKLFYGFLYTLTVYPIMISKDPDNVFESHHSRDEKAMNFKRRVMKQEKYQRVVKRLLPMFDSKGVID